MIEVRPALEVVIRVFSFSLWGLTLVFGDCRRCSRQIEQDFAVIVQRSHGDATRFGRPAGRNRNQLAIVDEAFDDSQIAVARSGLGLSR
jgi:hypothetical protein